MTSLARTLILAALLATNSKPAFAQPGRGGGPGATCRPADEFTAREVAHYQNVVTSSDSLMVDFRRRQQLPAVAVSQVVYVTEDSICAKAEAVYSAGLAGIGLTPSLRVHVIKIGDVYVVWDPAQRMGEFGIFMTLSSDYKVLAKRAG